MLYGYMRVSSTDQNLERQRIELEKAGVSPENIYAEKKSGKDFDRPEWKKVCRKLKPNDILCILSIDRMGRDYREIGEQWRYITRKRKADLRILDMPLLDTTRCKDLLGTFIADLVLQVLSFVAHSERERIRDRQRQGIAAAKARGVKFGRPFQPLPPNFGEIVERYTASEIGIIEASRLAGMPKSSFYTRAKQEYPEKCQARSCAKKAREAERTARYHEAEQRYIRDEWTAEQAAAHCGYSLGGFRNRYAREWLKRHGAALQEQTSMEGGGDA